MTLAEFISSSPVGVNGTYVDVDKLYGPECWDLVELYAEQVLQIPKNPWAVTLIPDGVAKNAWLNYDQNPQLIKYFDKIPAGQEKTGDITIYNGHGVYTEGHIAIKVDGGVFEQNADPDGSPAHISNRSTTYLLGSLRLKGENMSLMDSIIETDEDNRQVFLAWVARNPYAQEVGRYNGKTYREAANDIGKNADRQNLNTMMSAYYKNGSQIPSVPGAVPLAPGVYKVS